MVEVARFMYGSLGTGLQSFVLQGNFEEILKNFFVRKYQLELNDEYWNEY